MGAKGPIAFMVRHGRTALNSPANPRLRAWENPPLNRLGQLDAQMAAQRLKPYKPQIIYSSDLTRDLQTAEILSADLGNVPNEVDYDLRTADMGDLSGEKEADVHSLVQKWYREPWWRAPSGESLNDFLARFYPAIDVKLNLAKEVDSFKPSILVTHGRNIAAMHARTAGIPQWEAQMTLPGGVAMLYYDETGDLQLEFLTATEPIEKDL